jgi:hypothetical protein
VLTLVQTLCRTSICHIVCLIAASGECPKVAGCRPHRPHTCTPLERLQLALTGSLPLKINRRKADNCSRSNPITSERRLWPNKRQLIGQYFLPFQNQPSHQKYQISPYLFCTKADWDVYGLYVVRIRST